MAQDYNLTDNVNDSFTFELRDKKYSMRYPLTEETEQVQKISSQLDEAQKSKNTDEVKRLSDELESFIYDFITPEGHQTPIKEALSKEISEFCETLIR